MSMLPTPKLLHNALTGAFCQAELVGMIPASGGEYAYLAAAYPALGKFGDLIPVLYAWCNAVFLSPAQLAMQGLALSDYALSIPYSHCKPSPFLHVLVAFIFICKFIKSQLTL